MTGLRTMNGHEDTINSWDEFKVPFAKAFGQPEHGEQQARDQLLLRHQIKAESSTTSIEDVLRLRRRVDAQTTNSEPVPVRRRLCERAEVIDLTNDREPHSFHHYVLSLDIRSLLLRAAKGGSTQCYVRYHYPFLGTTVPFRSRPPTVVRPGTSATVVGGYASYHFAANSDMVEAAFTE
ncbi:hypothetical protein HPB47_002170 [Ixodes persulcatus]|uniref:Uncharacterized protein n=1 Tax=Ixodes persulcatus TaxID=34615 RepID=A0AC60R1V9_IXOPE|nr:hypothetical protein HPB47_002170 [Ixodes persulcatus]